MTPDHITRAILGPFSCAKIVRHGDHIAVTPLRPVLSPNHFDQPKRKDKAA